KQPQLAVVLAHRLHRAGQRAIEFLLLQIDPQQLMREQTGAGRHRVVGTDAERALGMREGGEMRRQESRGQQPETQAQRGLAHCRYPFAWQFSSSLVAKILLMSVPVGSLKKASVSVFWFSAMAVSGSGRITLLVQFAGMSSTFMLASSVKSMAV